MMKRTISESEENFSNIAKCLMLLSGREVSIDSLTNRSSSSSSPSRVFECKTCNRRFQSFQALGGHRASHKKPKLNGDHQQDDIGKLNLKPKTHECSICGLEFTIGQALGGHMRRHRAVVSTSPPPSSSMSSLVQMPPPVLKRSNSRRVLCLDLNLTPVENDLKLSLGNFFPEKIPASPMVHCFI